LGFDSFRKNFHKTWSMGTKTPQPMGLADPIPLNALVQFLFQGNSSLRVATFLKGAGPHAFVTSPFFARPFFQPGRILSQILTRLFPRRPIASHWPGFQSFFDRLVGWLQYSKQLDRPKTPPNLRRALPPFSPLYG